METQYCPDCIIELITVKKKIGMRINWMECPNCGFKIPPESEVDIEKLGKFIDRIKYRNKNENKYNRD